MAVQSFAMDCELVNIAQIRGKALLRCLMSTDREGDAIVRLPQETRLRLMRMLSKLATKRLHSVYNAGKWGKD